MPRREEEDMNDATALQLDAVRKTEEAATRLVSAYAEYVEAMGACMRASLTCAGRCGLDRGLAGLVEMKKNVREWRRDMTAKTQAVVHTASALAEAGASAAVEGMSREDLAELGDSMADKLTPEIYATIPEEAREGWREWRRRLGLPPMPEPEAVEAEMLETDDGAGSLPASAGVAGCLPGADRQYPGWTGWNPEGGMQ